MTANYTDPRYIQHEIVNDYITELYRELNIEYFRNSYYHRGPDIGGDIPTEIKGWDERRPSYSDIRYWKRLIHTKILSKFNSEYGIIVNTLEIPSKWRDFLRSHGIVPVYLDPSKSRNFHLRLLLSAYTQAISFKENSLHWDVIRTNKNIVNLKMNQIFYFLDEIEPPFEVKYRNELIKLDQLCPFSLVKPNSLDLIK